MRIGLGLLINGLLKGFFDFFFYYYFYNLGLRNETQALLKFCFTGFVPVQYAKLSEQWDGWMDELVKTGSRNLLSQAFIF